MRVINLRFRREENEMIIISSRLEKVLKNINIQRKIFQGVKHTHRENGKKKGRKKYRNGRGGSRPVHVLIHSRNL